jgi:hypothetical protein
MRTVWEDSSNERGLIMSVGFKVWSIWYIVGTADFLHAFFSTISCRLEPDGWGSKYPGLMNYLYSGKLEYKYVSSAIQELKEIQTALSQFAPSEVIWDIEDLTKQPPWGDRISNEITSLANYFVTCDGRDLITVLFKAFNRALELQTDVAIENM